MKEETQHTSAERITENDVGYVIPYKHGIEIFITAAELTKPDDITLADALITAGVQELQRRNKVILPACAKTADRTRALLLHLGNVETQGASVKQFITRNHFKVVPQGFEYYIDGVADHVRNELIESRSMQELSLNLFGDIPDKVTPDDKKSIVFLR